MQINTHTGKLMVPEKPTECESCNNPPRAFKFGMWLCDSCLNNSVLATANQAGQMIAAYNNPTVVRSLVIDNGLKLKTDIFNAETISINEIRTAIENDETITNKQFELAQVISNRIEKYKKLIFEMNEAIVEENNKQRAAQTYLNNLANQLRIEEREKLKLADVNYVPKIVKPVKPHQITKAKFDKAKLKELAAELGLSESTLQMVAVAKGKSLEDTANEIRRGIKEGLSESNKEN